MIEPIALETNAIGLRPGHVIVTGGASGIGLATAELLLVEGWKVALIDRDETNLNAARQRFPSTVPIFTCPVELTDEASVAAAIMSSQDALGPVTGLVNSAGIARDVSFLETSTALFREILDVSVIGSFLAAKYAVAAMISDNIAGAVVNIASVSGLRGNLGRSAYGASKGAIVTLTKVMAVELASKNIRVNAIAPGPVDTPLVQDLHAVKVRELWTRRVPQQRYANPSEIAHSIAYLLDPQKASYITGQILSVDGGFESGGLF